MKHLKIASAIFAATLAPAFFTGCSTVLPVSSSYTEPVYERGSLVFTLQNPIDSVSTAVEKALREDLKLAIINVAKDAICAEFEARTAQDQKVRVRLNYNTDKSTIIDIRVGLIGDQIISRQILDAVKARL
ncbi:MAG TPA: DUF3568 family protein [Opitutales bacterium]|nr:DUF3568 family protein [Opitutales bacterium]